ncbi:hypothetical protein ACOMHN_044488 [Nucella lapillus]
MSRKLSRLFKKCKESTKSSLRAKYQQAKVKTQREQRQSYWQYINSLISPPDDDDMPNKGQSQKRFWSYIKSLRRDNNGVAPLKKNGSMFCTAADKANILNQQYQYVFTREDSSNILSPSGEPFPSMANITISVEGVLKLLKKRQSPQGSWTRQHSCKGFQRMCDCARALARNLIHQVPHRRSRSG